MCEPAHRTVYRGVRYVTLWAASVGIQPKRWSDPRGGAASRFLAPTHGAEHVSERPDPNLARPGFGSPR